MKSESQIVDGIAELRDELKKQELRRKRHAQETGARRSNLGTKPTHLIEGEIAGLEWIVKG
jgi:hypothetical protein